MHAGFDVAAAQTVRRGRWLVWFAQTNRYFGMIIHPCSIRRAPATRRSKWSGAWTRSCSPTANDGKGAVNAYHVVSGRGSAGFVARSELAPTPARSTSVASPTRKTRASPGSSSPKSLSQHRRHVRFCTFEWLGNCCCSCSGSSTTTWCSTGRAAIILLVLVVRTILHPVFKPQIGIQKFAKDDSACSPGSRSAGEYKNDRQKMMQEQQRLFRSEGVSYTARSAACPCSCSRRSGSRSTRCCT